LAKERWADGLQPGDKVWFCAHGGAAAKEVEVVQLVRLPAAADTSAAVPRGDEKGQDAGAAGPQDAADAAGAGGAGGSDEVAPGAEKEGVAESVPEGGAAGDAVKEASEEEAGEPGDGQEVVAGAGDANADGGEANHTGTDAGEHSKAPARRRVVELVVRDSGIDFRRPLDRFSAERPDGAMMPGGEPPWLAEARKWDTHRSPEGDFYFHNTETGETTWERPQARPPPPPPSY